MSNTAHVPLSVLHAPSLLLLRDEHVTGKKTAVIYVQVYNGYFVKFRKSGVNPKNNEIGNYLRNDNGMRQIPTVVKHVVEDHSSSYKDAIEKMKKYNTNVAATTTYRQRQRQQRHHQQ